jgi:hypothetical protein
MRSVYGDKPVPIAFSWNKWWCYSYLGLDLLITRRHRTVGQTTQLFNWLCVILPFFLSGEKAAILADRCIFVTRRGKKTNASR